MLPNRTRSSLFVGLLVFLAALPAVADDFRELQLWAPAEVGPYGRGPQPGEGFFFVFDQMYWNVSRPATATIGWEDNTRAVWFGPNVDLFGQPIPGNEFIQTNTHDTSMLRSASLTGSQRFDVGRVIDRWGWFVSTYTLNTQHQELTMNNVGVVFEDPEFGGAGRRFLQGRYFIPGDPDAEPPIPDAETGLLDLPVIFNEMHVTNRTKHWNVELNMLYRTRQLHYGGFFEFFGGARYLEFQDQFTVSTFPPPEEVVVDDDENGNGDANGNGNGDGNPFGSLDYSLWDTRADNNVVGPQIGMRWFRQHGPWRVSAEGRFFAGINNQNITQTGILGSELDPTTFVYGRPDAVGSQGFSHRETTVVFSPAWEIRCNLHYQLTRHISAKVGWTGFWINSIARGSSMVDYRVNSLDSPSMGINMANNRQSVFAHGLNIGVEVNR